MIQQKLEKYNEKQQKVFLSVKPRLTGYSQIKSNKQASYNERIKIELYYIEHRNLKWDIKVFFETIFKRLGKE
ncbi:MAG: sugar transferase [Clostridia bacterium]